MNETIPLQVVLWATGILVTAITLLIGAVYRALANRVERLEQTLGDASDNWSEKTPTIIASSTRLNELERRMGRLEDKFDAWMQRIEDKLDRMNK